MAHEAEAGGRELLKKICGAPLTTPAWLKRPGKTECGTRWELVRTIYQALAGKELQREVMPVRETRRVDGVFCFEGTFIYELDEVQHFNSFRAATLAPTLRTYGWDSTRQPGWVAAPRRRSLKVVAGRRSDHPSSRARTAATSNAHFVTRSLT
jgi:hypothetical protein